MAAKKMTKAPKAKTEAKKAQKSVSVAKEALGKKNKEIAALKKYIARANLDAAGVDVATNKPSIDAYMARGEYKAGLAKLRQARVAKSKISQAVSDRSRSASRAAGIARRVAKKGK
jgi:hypothetical protein